MKPSRVVLACLVSALMLQSLLLCAQTATISSVSPNPITIHPGDSNVALHVTLGSGSYSGPITVTLTGLPSGIGVTPAIVTPGSSGTVLLSASRSADNAAFSGLGTVSDTVTAQVIAVAAGTVLGTSSLSVTVSLSNPSFAPSPQSINLPVVNINTGGVPVVTKTDRISGTITITSPDGQTTYLPNSSNSDNTATFHVHGNSTASMPKLPYELKLNTSIDLLTTMGMQCPYVTSKGKTVCDKSKTYILLANYNDKTFLRDWAASALANAIPIGNGYLNSPSNSPTPSGTSTLMPWAPHSLFVELYLNGVYEGNYQLIEKVNVDNNRININELAETDTTDDITGGYLLEIDQRADEDYVFITPQGVPIGLEDPDYTPEVPEQTEYITNYVDSAENTLFSANFTDPSLGWRAYFDEASLVNFYIVNDLMGNVDGGDFYSSNYLYKQQDNPLLYMGPVWDFDISSGNVNYASIFNPTVPWMQTQAPWYVQVFKDSALKADLITQWNALKTGGVFSAWLKSIQSEAQTLEQSQVNNFGRWPMQGIEVWPNIEAPGSYDGEVSYLTSWLNLRMAYLDALFNNKKQTTTSLNAPSGTLRQGVPATLQAVVSGGTSLTGTVTFMSNGMVLGTGALDGSGQASAPVLLPAGNNGLTAVYNGDDANALSSSNYVSATVLAPLVGTSTNLSYALTATGAENTSSLTVTVVENAGTTPPTGTATLMVDGQAMASANVVAGTALLAVPQLPSGTHALEAVYSGDSTYLGSSSNSLTKIVVPPTIQLSSTLNPAFGLAAVTFTAKVSSQSVTPTGTVIFYNGSTALGAAVALDANGTATLTVASLPVGTNSITAVYSGDLNVVGGSSSALEQDVVDFSLSLSNPSAPSLTVIPGQSGTFQLTVAPLAPAASLPDAISLSVSGLPSGVTCTLSPTTIAGGAGATTVTALVQVASVTARNAGGPNGSPLSRHAAPLTLAPLLLPWTRKFRSSGGLLLSVLLLAIAGLAATLVSGCGGSGYFGQAPQSYTITVTATAGNLSHTTQETLTIE